MPPIHVGRPPALGWTDAFSSDPLELIEHRRLDGFVGGREIGTARWAATVLPPHRDALSCSPSCAATPQEAPRDQKVLVDLLIELLAESNATLTDHAARRYLAAGRHAGRLEDRLRS